MVPNQIFLERLVKTIHYLQSHQIIIQPFSIQIFGWLFHSYENQDQMMGGWIGLNLCLFPTNMHTTALYRLYAARSSVWLMVNLSKCLMLSDESNFIEVVLKKEVTSNYVRQYNTSFLYLMTKYYILHIVKIDKRKRLRLTSN